MHTLDDLTPLLQHFEHDKRQYLLAQVDTYNELLDRLTEAEVLTSEEADVSSGILALNGASGAGQSYVLERLENLLAEGGIELPRIFLLATRKPRPGEGHKEPYIFVEEIEAGYRDIYDPDKMYRQEDIYYQYQSRPGAVNAILLQDVRRALDQKMYLETVIPTLIHMKEHQIGGIPAWGGKMQIVYLASPGGIEWLYRLLSREPSKLADSEFQAKLIGRVESSLKDMGQAADNSIRTVINHHGQGKQAAKEILSIWGY